MSFQDTNKITSPTHIAIYLPWVEFNKAFSLKKQDYQLKKLSWTDEIS